MVLTRFQKNAIGTSDEIVTEYRYDPAGRLHATLPPNYFAPTTAGEGEEWITTTRHNARSLIDRTSTPDTDEAARFVYDSEGRVSFSQSPRQVVEGTAAYYCYKDVRGSPNPLRYW